MAARRSASTTGDGDSSTIFWWRRWIEHSRSPRWTSPPWASPRICGRDRLGQVARRLDDPHPLATPAGGRLDEQGIADLVVGGRVAGRGQDRDAGLDRRPLGGQLVAHDLDRIGRRPDPGQSGRRDLGRERRVLREEAVARVDRVGAGRPRGGDDRRTVEVAVPEPDGLVGLGHERCVHVGVGVDRHAPQAHRARRAKDTAGDLAAVGDEQARERCAHRRHRRNTP
jgi:hypothetical protein